MKRITRICAAWCIAFSGMAVTHSVSAQDGVLIRDLITQEVTKLPLGILQMSSSFADADDAEQAIEQTLETAGRKLQQSISRVAFSAGANKAIALANRLTGQDMRAHSSLQYDDERGIAGDLDAVMPLSLAASANPNASRALFLQFGNTRYQDSANIDRNDLRYGGVFRFGETNGANYQRSGFWAYGQENAEYGHRRLRLGFERIYNANAFQIEHFMPLSDERIVGDYYERPIEKTVLSVNRVFSKTAIGNIAFTHSERTDGSGDFVTSAQLGLDYQSPRTNGLYGLRLGGIGNDGDFGALVSYKYLFGNGRTAKGKPQLNFTSRSFAGNDDFAPITSDGRIEVSRREVTPQVFTQANGITAQFLQKRTGNGGTLDIEVTLPQVASADTPLQVRLVSPNVENAAVAGVDFDATPIDVVIPAGEVSAVVTAQLLFNGEMNVVRKVAVRVDAL